MSTRLNLEFLRTRAKELLKAARAGDVEAIARIHRAHPVLGRANPGTIRTVVALHDAQLIIGREHGFSSWAQLKRYVEALAECELSGVEQVQAAIRAGDIDAVKALITTQPDLVASRTEPLGWTPLHGAASVGNLECVRLLLDAGANIDSRDTEWKRTPIDLALHTGKTGAYERLQAHGAVADPKLLALVESPERAERMARLHTALVDDDVEAVAQSLDADPALLNARLPDVWGSGGTFGATPLHWAAFLGHIELARLLLGRGADLTLRDLTYDSTPLGWACESRRSSEMTAFLKVRGAN